jgi:6-phosphogluconolactonase
LRENKRLAIAVNLKRLKNKRVSLTLPVINNALNIIFLICGRNKAKVLREILEGKENLLPASRVKPEKGKLFFLVS